MIEGSYRSWDLYTTGQLMDGLQQKRKPAFIKQKWNHVVFSRATILSFHPVDKLKWDFEHIIDKLSWVFEHVTDQPDFNYCKTIQLTFHYLIVAFFFFFSGILYISAW